LVETVQLDLLLDAQVVERVRAGETGLYEAIMRRYNQRLYRIARSIVGDAGEAEDVVQDAYVRAYINLGQFAGTAQFSTWLTRIAIHEALARVRQRKRMSDGAGSMDSEKFDRIENLESSMPDPEEQASEKESAAILEAAVDALPARLRAVFMMREIQEMSTAETAECLGLTEETVKIRLFRARKLLRSALHQRTGAESSHAFRFLGDRCDRIVQHVMARINSI
jgi:RNA polymerase sigma-70 factor (ECF subfamily)